MDASTETNPLPSGIRAIAILSAACAIYLGATGLLMLARPGLIAMSAGAPLLFGLELAGPFMFLITAGIAAAISLGLLRRINLARRAAVLAAVAGVVMLVPPLSAAVTLVQFGALVRSGVGMIVRVMVIWYLSRAEIAEEFTPKQKAS